MTFLGKAPFGRKPFQNLPARLAPSLSPPKTFARGIQPVFVCGNGPTGIHPLNFLDSSTPDAQPPRQSKIFEEEGGGSEGEGGTFYRKFLPPPPS